MVVILILSAHVLLLEAVEDMQLGQQHLLMWEMAEETVVLAVLLGVVIYKVALVAQRGIRAMEAMELHSPADLAYLQPQDLVAAVAEQADKTVDLEDKVVPVELACLDKDVTALLEQELM
jgi:hypothetical protein